jgi:hypothetical protein
VYTTVCKQKAADHRQACGIHVHAKRQQNIIIETLQFPATFFRTTKQASKQTGVHPWTMMYVPPRRSRFQACFFVVSDVDGDRAWDQKRTKNLMPLGT